MRGILSSLTTGASYYLSGPTRSASNDPHRSIRSSSNEKIGILLIPRTARMEPTLKTRQAISLADDPARNATHRPGTSTSIGLDLNAELGRLRGCRLRSSTTPSAPTIEPL